MNNSEDDKVFSSLNTILPQGIMGFQSSNDEEELFEKKVEHIEHKSKTKNLTQSVKKELTMKLQKLMDHFHRQEYVRIADKIMFVIGAVRILFESFLLGRQPCLYPLYYTVIFFVSIFIRFFYYRYMKWHYFMLDFCYFANFLLMMFLWICPSNQYIIISVYAFSMGPLLLAVPIFRNSLVLHSFDKLTSSCIHLGPALIMWAIRYNKCECWSIADLKPTLAVYLTNSLAFYLIWAIIYYIIMFLTFERCEKKKNTTLFSYHLEQKNSIFFVLTGLMGEKLRKISFMFIHLFFSIFTLLVTYISFYYELLHMTFFNVALLFTLWNAATYYMEIFSKNYELKLQKLEKIKFRLSKDE